MTRAWVRTLARIGIASRGVIYLVLAYLAFDIARHGSAPSPTSSTGALDDVSSRVGGKFLLVVLAIGLACYGVWRLLDTLAGRHGFSKRVASFIIAIIYFGLCVRAIGLLAGHAGGRGPSSNPQPWVARAMGWPGGPEIVGIAGAVLVGGGAGLAIWGIFHRYQKDLALERLTNGWRKAVGTLGAVGDLARGTLVALVGSYLLEAAIHTNPAQAKSVDEALRSLVHHSNGPTHRAPYSRGKCVYPFHDLGWP